MKLDQLRKIIREEVKNAVKEELQDILNEAVKIASTPNKYSPAPKTGTSDWSAAKKPTNLDFSNSSIGSMLEQTRASMSGQDYRNVVNADSSLVKRPNFAASMASNMGMTENAGPMPGIDISKLDFVSKAKSILDLSNKKDKQKAGIL